MYNRLQRIAEGTPIHFLDKDDSGDNAATPGDDNTTQTDSSNQANQENQPTGSVYTIKANGKEIQLTMEELIQKAELAEGAAQKFQQAADFRKQAEEKQRESEKAVRTYELITKKTQDGGSAQLTPAEVKELSELLGMELESGAEDSMDNNQQQENKQPSKIRREDMDPEVGQYIDWAKEQALAGMRKNIKETTQQDIDKDSVLSNILSDVPDKAKNRLLDIAYDKVKSRILAGDEYGDTLRQQIVQEMRQVVSDIGVPGSTANTQPVVGFGSNSILPAEVLGKDPIQRVKSTSNDDDYFDNLTKRVQQMMLKSNRGGKS